jgi:hypothetical protein
MSLVVAVRSRTNFILSSANANSERIRSTGGLFVMDGVGT